MESKKCILMVRVSTEEQSLDEQRLQLINKALSDGYTDDEIEIIEEKESGIKLTEDERRGLNRMYECIDSNPVECVYVWDLSRLSRRQEILFKLKNFFIEKKINLICLTPTFKLLNEKKELDTNIDLVYNMFMSFCDTSIKIDKAKFRRSRIKDARNMKYIGGFIKYGYTLNENNFYQINEDEATIIRLVFNLYESGLSEMGVAKELQQRGYDIRANKVRQILTSVEYTGYIPATITYEKRKGKQTKLERFERYYPVIISKEQFEHCRELAKENNINANKTKNIYYAHRLIKCPCGRYWMAMKSAKNYSCYLSKVDRNFKSGYNVSCDNHESISINLIDSLLWQITPKLEADYLTEQAELDVKRLNDEIELYNVKLTALLPQQNKINNLKDRNNDLYLNGDIDRNKFESNKEKYVKMNKDVTNNRTKYLNEIERIKELIKSINSKYVYHFGDINIELNHHFEDIEQMKYDDRFNLISKITDDQIRYDLIHKHIREVRISDYVTNKTKQIDIELVNGKVQTWFYNYRGAMNQRIWFIHSEDGFAKGQKAALILNYLNRFKR
jgi:DNA invertase Pin-like site-specific DNA recombinase